MGMVCVFCTSDTDCGNGECKWVNDAYACECKDGWFGERCMYLEEDYACITDSDCKNNGRCIKGGLECECETGYQGRQCEDEEEPVQTQDEDNKNDANEADANEADHRVPYEADATEPDFFLF